MISFVMVGTNDIARAKQFYDALMPLLGAAPAAWTSDKALFYGSGTGPMFAVTKPYDGLAANNGNGTMVALIAGSRAAVEQIHAKAIALGGVDEGGPGIRGQNPNGYFIAYFRDPDGNKLSVSWFGPPDESPGLAGE